MKNKLLIGISFVVICLLSNYCLNAQTNIKLMDLSMRPIIKLDTIASDSIELVVSFKINKPNLANSAHFWLGSAKDSSNVLSLNPIFSSIGNTTTLTISGESIEVKNYLAVFHIKISSVIYSTPFKATLFVESNLGQFSNRLYY